MRIESITLRGFRNYEEESFAFHESMNLVVGGNGQGKTNLIEAVNLLSMGKSFRTRKDQEMARAGGGGFSVKGVFAKHGSPYEVEVSYSEEGYGKKRYTINGAEKASVFDILGGVYTVVFSPEDLALAKGPPDVRRRFLDRELILLRPMYYHKLKRYKGTLRSRNAFLKTGAFDLGLLDVYDEQLALAGAEVMEERARYVAALAEESAKCAAHITDGAEALSVGYSANVGGWELAGAAAGNAAGYEAKGTTTAQGGQTGGEEAPAAEWAKATKEAKENIKEAFLCALRAGRNRDLAVRSTEAGPHRDDISLCANGMDLRIYGSQGQKRTAALALRLGERALIKKETGEDAIILLDDVMSELDKSRQARIMSGFSGNQVFVTSAEPPSGYEGAGCRLIRIAGGKAS